MIENLCKRYIFQACQKISPISSGKAFRLRHIHIWTWEKKKKSPKFWRRKFFSRFLKLMLSICKSWIIARNIHVTGTISFKVVINECYMKMRLKLFSVIFFYGRSIPYLMKWLSLLIMYQNWDQEGKDFFETIMALIYFFLLKGFRKIWRISPSAFRNFLSIFSPKGNILKLFKSVSDTSSLHTKNNLIHPFIR